MGLAKLKVKIVMTNPCPRFCSWPSGVFVNIAINIHINTASAPSSEEGNEPS